MGTELFEQQIRKHDRIALWYSSANRDESVFVDGEQIRVERENAWRHLSFDYGIHRCVGAPEIVPACFVHGYRKMMVELERY